MNDELKGVLIVSLMGAVTGLGYVLLRDVLVGGQSLGKKMQGLRAVTSAGASVSVADSARRNALFALGPVLGTIIKLSDILYFFSTYN